MFGLIGTARSKKLPTSPGGVDVSNSGTIDAYVGLAQLAGEFGTRFLPSTGAAPTAAGGPTIAVTGQTTINNASGFGAYAIDSMTPFQKIYVTAVGTTGFIQIDLAAPVTSQGISLAYSSVPANFILQFRVASSGGAVGSATSLAITAVAGRVGSLVASARPVRASLSMARPA